MTSAQGKKKNRGGRRGLALLLVVPLLLTAGCPGGWELGVYRTLAVTQVNYEKVYAAVVELHLNGQITVSQYEQAKLTANRIYALGKGTTAMMVSYRTIKDDASKRRIDSAIAELPKLVAELLNLIEAVRGRSPAAPATQEEQKQIEHKLIRVNEELETLEALRPVVSELRETNP